MFDCMGALSTSYNENPKIASRAFDKNRDGFVIAGGGGIIVLEELEHAKKRGAKIYAEVGGYGFSCDAYHITAPCTDGEGAVACMRNAIADAGVQTGQIGYVNAHGTSTMADSIETGAIKTVFGEYAHKGLLVSSTKSMTGHLLGAAGAIEALLCTLALKEGTIPPTINLENPGEGCDLDYIPGKARKAQLEYVMSNSFGFGGTNASIVLKAFR